MGFFVGLGLKKIKPDNRCYLIGTHNLKCFLLQCGITVFD